MKLFNRFAQNNETAMNRFENTLTAQQMLSVRGGEGDDDSGTENKGVDPEAQADAQQDTWNS
ncbi:MAG: hypothetical protein R6U66_01755 [Bacteroidales bacterium]